MIYRQGDVLMLANAQLPDRAKPVEPANGKVILAWGEVTGHHHRIEEPAKARLWDAGAERYLQVLEQCVLVHEEHAPVTLPPGTYLIPTQVSMTAGALRRVVD